MKIKAIVVDFDGTIITEDIISILCDLVGKKEDSIKLNDLFYQGKLRGLEALIQRVNFLEGLSLKQIHDVVSKNHYLQKGAEEFFGFLKENNIISIIASGSIMPLLEIYKEKLGADYLVGSKPPIENGYLGLISENDYSGEDFKVRDLKAILKNTNISFDSLVAIGDSPADKGIFELASRSIAINPKGDIAQYANYVINDDLAKAIPILKDLINTFPIKA